MVDLRKSKRRREDVYVYPIDVFQKLKVSKTYFLLVESTRHQLDIHGYLVNVF